MKEFMLLFIGGNYEELGLSPEELQGRMGKWFGWVEKLQKQGIYKGGEALLNPAKRVSGSDKTVSDGPFVEGKELVGGFFHVMAKDFDEAVKITADFPDYDLGGIVEVREIMKFDQ